MCVVERREQFDRVSKQYFLKLRNNQFLLSKSPGFKLNQHKLQQEHRQVIELVKRNYGQIQLNQQEKIDLTRKLLSFTELNFDQLDSVPSHEQINSKKREHK